MDNATRATKIHQLSALVAKAKKLKTEIEKADAEQQRDNFEIEQFEEKMNKEGHNV
jgi:hypothetical protein